MMYMSRIPVVNIPPETVKKKFTFKPNTDIQ